LLKPKNQSFMKNILLLSFNVLFVVTMQSQTLVAHYPLDRDGTDISGNALHGTDQNLTAVDNKDGEVGKATEFMTNSSVDVYDTTAFNFGLEGSMTLSYWYKTSDVNNFNGIFCNVTGAWASGVLSSLNWSDAGNILFACGAEGFGGLPNVAAISTTTDNMND
jgi:hypothetical protein